jgi:hypothetical protein
VKIYVVSAGRPASQKTASFLLRAGVEFTTLVPSGEVADYRRALPDSHISAEPAGMRGIRAKRQWLLDKVRGPLVMLDDDLTFYARQAGEPPTFGRAEPPQLRAMLDQVAVMLGQYAHGGVADRFMWQSRPLHTQFNKRYTHVLCYNTTLFPKPPPRYRTETAEDIDLCLQLLLLGKSSFLLTDWAQSDVPWAPGGCSSWRTPELSDDSICQLARYFPDIVLIGGESSPTRGRGTPGFKFRIRWHEAAKRGGCA